MINQNNKFNQNYTPNNTSISNKNFLSNQNISKYEKISTKYKIKFFNFFLNAYLNKFGGYNLDHDDMVYKIANFGAKVRPTYLSFVFGTKQEDIYGFIDLLESFEIFDIKQLQRNIVQIYFPFTESRIKQLKYKRLKTEKQKILKQMVLDCYRKMKEINYQENFK